MDKELFIPRPGENAENYSFYVAFDSGKTIYFQVPINVYSYEGTE